MLTKTNLEECAAVRFFKGDQKKRAKYLRAFPGRWDNDSHFIRSAVISFARLLDKELKQRSWERRVRR